MSSLINKLIIAVGSRIRQLLFFLFAALFILGLNVCSNGQDTDFLLQLKSPKDQVLSDIDVMNEYYYCVGVQGDTNIFIEKHAQGFIYKISFQGYLSDSVLFSIPERWLSFEIIMPVGTDSMLIVGFSSDSTDNHFDTRLELYIVNTQLEVINHKSFSIALQRKPFWVFADKCASGNYILSGATGFYPNPSLRMFYFKTDAQLDSLAYWEHPEPTWLNLASKIKELNDSVYWACEFGLYGQVFVTMDTLFNHLEYTKAPNYLSDNWGIRWVNDASFYALGEWNDGPDDDVGIIRMFDPLDTTGHLFTTWGTLDTMDFPAVTNGLDFQNIDTIFTGGTTNFSLWNWGNSYFFLTQYDSMLNLRWERFYGGDGYYQLYKIIATSDGGCVMAGTFNEANYTWLQCDPVIIKVNNEGYIVNTPENPPIQARETIVFPNPGQDRLNIRLARQYPSAALFLYNMSGQLMLSKELTGPLSQVNTTHLAPGSYVYVIANSKGLKEGGVWVKE